MTKQPLNVLENLAIIPDPSIVDKGFYLPNLTQEEMIAFAPSSEDATFLLSSAKDSLLLVLKYH